MYQKYYIIKYKSERSNGDISRSTLRNLRKEGVLKAERLPKSGNQQKEKSEKF